MSLGIAVAVIAAAYVIRSVVLRGGDFTPDVPGDIIAAIALLVGIVGVAWVRATVKEDDPSEESSDGSGDSRGADRD